jgi:hypothetical protein
MNMHVRELTPTQREAVERSRNFRESIAAKAAELADNKMRVKLAAAIPVAALNAPLTVTPQPLLMQAGAELPTPSSPNWFVILASDPIKRDHPSIREIQTAVCKHYGVKLADMLSARRTAIVVRPRQVAMYLCKELTPHSLPQLGRRFGGRDHTTVLHAVRKVPAVSRVDAELAQDIAILFETITGTLQ